MDRCEVCGRRTRKIDLVRTNVDFMAAGGSNYINNSSYTTDSWAVDTASDAGNISIGSFADHARISISDGNTLTEINGPQTWSGSGTIRTTYSIDVSSWSTFVFSADIGPYHRETSPSTTFSLGICDSDGSNKEELSSWTVNANARAWYTLNVSDIPAGKSASALYFYISATAVGKKWWADRIQLEKNVTKMGAFVPTTGSSIDRVDTPMMTVRKVCADCFERPRLRSEQVNREAEQRTEDPVSVDIQEV